MTSKSKIVTALVMAVPFMLNGCGGGGGGGSSSTSPVITTAATTTTTTTTTTTLALADIQTTVPTPTYAASSEELTFFNDLNALRKSMGLGMLSQSVELDTAAKNHINYLISNPSEDDSVNTGACGALAAHCEISGHGGFTGVSYVDRQIAALYTGTPVTELIGGGIGEGNKSVLLDGLMGTIYHRAYLMSEKARDMGVGIGNDAGKRAEVVYGYKTPQRNATDFVGIYPIANQINVLPSFDLEAPNPFPDVVGTRAFTELSFPINVVVSDAATLSVTSFTVTEAGASSPLSARLVTNASDSLVGKNFAFLVANALFKSNTVYTVNFVGSADGRAISKTWSFTTMTYTVTP